MPRLLVTCDLHQHLPKWRRLAEVCVWEKPSQLLVAGDLLPKTPPVRESQREFLAKVLPGLFEEFCQLVGSPPLLFFGNDDWHEHEPLLEKLDRRGLCVNLRDRVIRRDGLVFCGMNRVRDYPFGYKHWVARDGGFVDHPVQYALRTPEARAEHRRNLLGQPSLGDRLQTVASQLRDDEMPRSIWLIHQPPAGHGLDVLGDGSGCGSTDVLDFIARSQPLLTCHGHIHESPHSPGGRWLAVIGDTVALQPGQIGERLHYVTLDVDDAGNASNYRHSVFGQAAVGFQRFPV